MIMNLYIVRIIQTGSNVVGVGNVSHTTVTIVAEFVIETKTGDMETNM